MSISISSFGALPDGRAAALYTLTNPSGAQLCLTDYGARIVAVRVPDRTGNLADVAPSNAPHTMAASKHTHQGSCSASAQYRLAPAPATYWPAAPILNRPTL